MKEGPSLYTQEACECILYGFNNLFQNQLPLMYKNLLDLGHVLKVGLKVFFDLSVLICMFPPPGNICNKQSKIRLLLFLENAFFPLK